MESKMAKIEQFYGKLTPNCLARLDELLLKLQRLNKVHLGSKKVDPKKIVALPEEEYLELWGYLRHCCVLAVNWPNKRRAIRMVASKREMSFEEVMGEAVDSLTIHCYTYAWRHYEHSEDSSAYVLSTAKFGWLTWIEEQNNASCAGVDNIRDEHRAEETRCGRQLHNVNVV